MYITLVASVGCSLEPKERVGYDMNPTFPEVSMKEWMSVSVGTRERESAMSSELPCNYKLKASIVSQTLIRITGASKGQLIEGYLK